MILIVLVVVNVLVLAGYGLTVERGLKLNADMNQIRRSKG
jgi:hypothetical protein